MDYHLYLNSIYSWIITNGFQIVLIVVGGVVVYKIVAFFLMRSIDLSILKSKRKDLAQRMNSLGRVALLIWKIIAIAIVIVTILPLMGIEIAPLLTGAGIIGLALSLGFQSFIKDFIVGINVLLEDQYRIEDHVSINNIEGAIEDMNLRSVKLRDKDGIVHFISNSSIISVANYSRRWRYITLGLDMGNSKPLEEIRAAILKIMNNIITSSKYKDHYLAKPSVKVAAFTSAVISLEVSVKVSSSYRQRIFEELAGLFYPRMSETGLQIKEK